VVLVVTNRDDLTADWLILELRERGASFVRFNTEDYPGRVSISWTPSGGSCLRLPEGDVRSDEVTSVWFRRPLPPAVPDDVDEDIRSWAANEAQEALDGVWRTLDARWVNHPDANYLAGCKPEQLTRAHRAGFEIPPTLLTNDAIRLRDFEREFGPALICKAVYEGWVPSASGDRAFWTTEFNLDEDDSLEDLSAEPYLFQARISKAHDIRVTVIGNRVFAVGIGSQATPESELDWRRGDVDELDHWVEELPEQIGQQCLEFVRSYGLAFGAIDLARRVDGGYTFFELNPNGQWAWIEQRTGLPLRAHLVDLLLGCS